jgi:beta-glucanase (GH16 family)
MFGTYSVKAQNIIKVISPAYCSDIKGNTKIDIFAPGFTKLTVKCWKQGNNLGVDSSVGSVTLNDRGQGSIIFPAGKYPNGPVTVRISGISGTNTDNCYLQLYNKGGVLWNQGIPTDPPSAKGMRLVFSDDFDNTLSIGNDSTKKYYDHKPPFGKEDFSSIPFTSFDSPNNPFSQVDTYLRIRADANKNSAGLISSMFSDKKGFTTKAPCYFECRFIGPNAPGTWPAFWLLNVKDDINSNKEPNDELDIIEAYGGEGKGLPNSGPLYSVAAHAWSQTGAPVEISKEFHRTNFPVDMTIHGIPSTWYEAPHTYGCLITETETKYYCDDIEVAKHETLPISKVKPFYFMINMATGGGWPVDLSRYNGVADMYVDYVRVYSGVTAKP